MNSKVQTFNGIPLPSAIEISNSGTCNRSCSFCPRSSKDYPDIKEFIDFRLVEKLSKELSSMNYKGMVSFCGFVEPLLDKNIFDDIKVIKSKNPNCSVEIITNGDPITINNLDKLEDVGLDYLVISCYDGPHQIDEIDDLIQQSKLPREKAIFRNRWLGPEDNFNISLSNRGGLMKSAEYPIDDLSQSLALPCHIPSYKMFLNYTGEVLVCDHDWGKKGIMGNFKYQSLFEIWTGDMFMKYRYSLLKGDRSLSPCNVCNVKGNRIGNNHVQAWKEKGDR